MTIPQRIKVKYFVQEPAAVDLPAFIPVFHHWIQEHRVEGLLIDVADYKHMQNGPGIVLIGHEADYALDLAGGRPGLIYDRKRQWEAAATLPATGSRANGRKLQHLAHKPHLVQLCNHKV